MDVFNLQASIGLNTKNYIDGIKNCMSLGSKLKSSLEQSAQSVTKQQMAIDTLGNKLEGAKSATSDARNAVSRLTDEFNKSVKATGAVSDESRELASSLDKAEKELADCEKQERELTEQADELRKGTKKAGDQAEESASKFSKFNDGLKAVASTAGKVVSAVAKISADAVGAAATGLAALTKQALDASGTYEQLSGGAQKIFDTMDYSVIANDAANAYKDLNMSVNEYLEAINLAGATFAQTMGDEKGYKTARTGMLAIADYASGTGKSIDELNQKYQMITRAASSYQSIADQFSGILPATSADFLAQAQAAGILETSYKKLTDVPVAEYQEAVTKMLEKGVDALGLSQNTARESAETITGSMAMVKSAWENLVTAFGTDDMPIETASKVFVESVTAMASNTIPRIGEIVKNIGSTLPGLFSELFTKLKASFEDSDIGTAILDSIDSLVTNAADVLESIIGSLFDGDNLSNLIERAIGTGETIASVLWNILQKGLEALPGKLGDIVTLFNGIINKIVGGISEAISADGAGEFLTAVIDAVLSIAENLASNIQPLVNAALTLVTGIVDGLIGHLDEIINAANTILMTLIDAIVKDDGILDGVVKLVTGIVGALSENSDNILIAIQELIVAIWDKVISDEVIGKIADAALQMGTALINGLLTIEGNLLGFVVSMFGEFINTIYEKVTSGEVLDIGKSLIDAILNVPVLGEAIQTWWTAFTIFGEDIYEKIEEFKTKWSEFWANIGVTLVENVESFKEKLQAIQDKFMELVNNAKQWGLDLISNFVSGLQDSPVIKGTSKIAQTVKDYLGFSEPDKGPLSDFHTYAPDMIDLFTKGIEQNGYKIEDAFDKSLDFGVVSTSGSAQSGSASNGAVNVTFTAELLSVLHEILYAIKEGKTISVSAIDSALGQLQSIDERTDFA